MKSIWQRCHERAEMIGRKNNMYLRTRGPAPSASPPRRRRLPGWTRAGSPSSTTPTPSPSSPPVGRHTDISELSPVPRLSNNFKSPPKKKKKNPARIKGRVDHSSLPSLRTALQGNNSRRRKTKSGSHPLSHTLSCRGKKKKRKKRQRSPEDTGRTLLSSPRLTHNKKQIRLRLV